MGEMKMLLLTLELEIAIVIQMTAYPVTAKNSECLDSSECGQQQACIKQKCMNPCEGFCGQNSNCNVINHSPICTCRPLYTGDPFNGCSKISDANGTSSLSNPCLLSPCGPFSQCRNIAGQPSCSCLSGYTGSPPNCRPACVNTDCPNEKACINGTCADPCPESCGTNAQCRVVNHLAICTCFDGYVGDPFISCTPTPSIGTIPTYTTTTETLLDSVLEPIDEDIES